MQYHGFENDVYTRVGKRDETRRKKGGELVTTSNSALVLLCPSSDVHFSSGPRNTKMLDSLFSLFRSSSFSLRLAFFPFSFVLPQVI